MHPYKLSNWQAPADAELKNNLYPNYDPRHNTGMVVHLFGGWQWETTNGQEYRTNADGAGLFHRAADGNWSQSRGTCQFSLPNERSRVVRMLRREFTLAMI